MKYVATASFEGREGGKRPGDEIRDADYGAELVRLGIAKAVPENKMQPEPENKSDKRKGK